MKHFLTVDDLSPSDMEVLLTHAHQLKRDRSACVPSHALAGKTIVLLFEKPSLRTRVSFEIAARELGGTSLYLSPQEVGLGARESVGDVAQVLSRFAHAAVLRTFSHTTVEEFASHATIPVINGLTDGHHPCQALADMLTITECFGSPRGRTLAYVGDGNNVASSLVQAAAKAGMHIRVATPSGYELPSQVLSAAKGDAVGTGATIMLTHSAEEAATGADVLYTDAWTSMGQEAEKALRSSIFQPYQVTARLLGLAAPDAIVMHPLPAHRGEEVSDEVLDGLQSQVFTQAENRLHAQKAVLMALVAERVAVA